MKRALSGIRCSGVIHIGNYLGAVKQWVVEQNEYENIYFLADLHAITTPIEPKDLKENIYKSLAIYLSCGLDPKKSIIFLQSQMPQHPELGWILNCLTYMGELSRMTQYKEKSEIQNLKSEINSKLKTQNSPSVGLFDYPVLMAADILLYQADMVPVGEDQKQHVEFTRGLAKRFNNKYGETFKIPEVKIKKEAARIMGLDNPEKKMAKSAESQYNYIALLDDPSLIKKKISRAVTDSQKEIKLDPKRKGLFNLMTIYHLFSGLEASEIEDKYKGKGYKEFKEDLANIIIDALKPIQEKYNKLIKDKPYLDKILKEGADKARPIAQKTLDDVKRRIGFVI